MGGYLANEAFSEPKSDKMDKRGDVLIILAEGYSVFRCIFFALFLLIRFSSLLPRRQIYIGPSVF